MIPYDIRYHPLSLALSRPGTPFNTAPHPKETNFLTHILQGSQFPLRWTPHASYPTMPPRGPGVLNITGTRTAYA